MGRPNPWLPEIVLLPTPIIIYKVFSTSADPPFAHRAVRGPSLPPACSANGAVVSPDGKRLAMSTYRCGNGPHLLITDLQGNNPESISLGRECLSVAWRFDGSAVYCRALFDDHTLFAYDLAKKSLGKLVLPADSAYQMFSFAESRAQNGRWFVAERKHTASNNTDLYLVDDVKHPTSWRQLTNDGASSGPSF